MPRRFPHRHLCGALLVISALGSTAAAQPTRPTPVGVQRPTESRLSFAGASGPRAVTRDTQRERASWPRGARGALIGGAAGLLFGFYAMGALCDVACDGHPDNGRVLLVSTAGGRELGQLPPTAGTT
jgi:hypothetical protein